MNSIVIFVAKSKSNFHKTLFKSFLKVFIENLASYDLRNDKRFGIPYIFCDLFSVFLVVWQDS